MRWSIFISWFCHILHWALADFPPFITGVCSWDRGRFNPRTIPYPSPFPHYFSNLHFCSLELCCIFHWLCLVLAISWAMAGEDHPTVIFLTSLIFQLYTMLLNPIICWTTSVHLSINPLYWVAVWFNMLTVFVFVSLLSWSQFFIAINVNLYVMAFVLLFNKIFEYKNCCNSTKMVFDGKITLRVYYICIKCNRIEL